MSIIKDVKGFEVLDSRGNPTIAAEIILESGCTGMAMVPSGASTGSREALELRDGGDRYLGKGVKNAIKKITTIIKENLIGQSTADQAAIDNLLLNLDGTDNKSNLGANTLLAISLSVAKAAAAAQQIPLFQHIAQIYSPNIKYSMPVPMMNIINGGAHADNNIDIQEFMIQPVGASNFAEALRYGVEIFHALKSLLKQQGLVTAVGDEGGFAPNLTANKAALDLIIKAVETAGFTMNSDITLALDVAATEFYSEGKYHLQGEDISYTSEQFVDYLQSLVDSYPIISIEDGMDESDWDGWKYLTEKMGDKIQLVGDDLFVTNSKILTEGINKKIANAILIKLNQIGTLSETLGAIKLAHENNYSTIISHRSGETEDTTIADLAVGTAAGQIKTGSVCRSDRVAKYNRLLRIEADLNRDINYNGIKEFHFL